MTRTIPVRTPQGRESTLDRFRREMTNCPLNWEAVYARLDDEWSKVKKALQEFDVKSNERIAIDDECVLEWRGRELDFYLHFFVKGENVESRNYSEWSTRERYEILSHVPALLQRIIELRSAIHSWMLPTDLQQHLRRPLGNETR